MQHCLQPKMKQHLPLHTQTKLGRKIPTERALSKRKVLYVPLPQVEHVPHNAEIDNGMIEAMSP